MDVAFLVAEIEELGVRFHVERLHVGIEGREQTVIAMDYPSAEIEDLVYEQIQILRRRRRQVRSYLLTRPSGLFDLLSSRFAEISRSVGQKESTEDAVAITAAAGSRNSMRDSSSCCAASVAYVRSKRLASIVSSSESRRQAEISGRGVMRPPRSHSPACW